ncbi:MAG: hypothetical protein EOP11_24705, partial [Proteobacteria bacterium]
MVNFLSRLKFGALTLGFIVALMASPPASLSASGAEGAKRYKKSTVVDFEGALVEGKSRKPYSAYLTQQKESAFNDLNQWQP